jgi:transposase
VLEFQNFKNLGTEQVPPSSGGILSLGITVPLPLAVELYKAKLLTEVYSVRIHARIARHPWARLWYLCRGIDKDGSGHVNIPLEAAQSFLDCSNKTIYRWLQQGKRKGAFNSCHVRKGILEVYLGSLFKVCVKLNLLKWGVVGECPLSEVNAHIRASVTGIVTQQFQQKSRYAADKKLKPEYRKQFGTVHPNSLMKSVGQSSLKPDVGEVPRVLHISDRRIFVSKNFTVFGTSQATIASEFYIHPVTVQRHHAQLGTTRRQLCQKKGEYTHVKQALKNESDDFQALDPMGSGKYSEVGFKIHGDKAVFSDGIPLGAKKKTPNHYVTSTDGLQRRLFTTGKKRKTTWLAKCNLYAEEFTLTTMRAAQRKFKSNLQRGVYGNCHTPDCASSQRTGAGG